MPTKFDGDIYMLIRSFGFFRPSSGPAGRPDSRLSVPVISADSEQNCFRPGR